jgi:salicylate hydroxylase
MWEEDLVAFARKAVLTNTGCRVVHRADYHEILTQRATELGAKICLGVKVVDVDFESGCVYASDGRTFDSDVVIGADGE